MQIKADDVTDWRPWIAAASVILFANIKDILKFIRKRWSKRIEVQDQKNDQREALKLTEQEALKAENKALQQQLIEKSEQSQERLLSEIERQLIQMTADRDYYRDQFRFLLMNEGQEARFLAADREIRRQDSVIDLGELGNIKSEPRDD